MPCIRPCFEWGLTMFLKCLYLSPKTEIDVLIKKVLIQNNACFRDCNGLKDAKTDRLTYRQLKREYMEEENTDRTIHQQTNRQKAQWRLQRRLRRPQGPLEEAKKNTMPICKPSMTDLIQLEYDETKVFSLQLFCFQAMRRPLWPTWKTIQL